MLKNIFIKNQQFYLKFEVNFLLVNRQNNKLTKMEKMEIFKKQKYTETFFKILEQQEKIYGNTLSKKNMEKLLELHLSICEKEN